MSVPSFFFACSRDDGLTLTQLRCPGTGRVTMWVIHTDPFQNKQGKSYVENLARDVDKEEKIGVVVIINAFCMD